MLELFALAGPDFASILFCFMLVWEVIQSVPLARALIFATLTFHASLFAAIACSSVQFRFASTSIKRSPSRRNLCMWRTACLMSLSVPSLFGWSRRMCPSHFILRARIQSSRLKVVVLCDASSCRERPVICDNIKAFAPFIILQVLSSSGHASEPYARIEQHPDTYSLMRRSSSTSCACSMCLSLPARDRACAIRLRTSGRWSPDGTKSEPRYSNSQQLLTSRSVLVCLQWPCKQTSPL